MSLLGMVLVVVAMAGWPAGGWAATGSRPLSGRVASRERALVAVVAPQLGRYEHELSRVQAWLADTGGARWSSGLAGGSLDAYGASVHASATPRTVEELLNATRGLLGPARRALADLEKDVKRGAFRSLSGIASAASQIAGVLNPSNVPINKLKRAASELIGALAATLPPVSLAVGPGQPMGSCPRSEDPIDCWILQGENGLALSNALGYTNVLASIVGLIAGIGEIPTLGFDTPLTVGSDVVGTGTSVAQFYVDMVRRAGYDGSVVNKVVAAFMDAASVGTSIFDLGLLGDSLRLKAVSKAVEDAAPALEAAVDAAGKVIPAGEEAAKGVDAVEDLAKLRDAKDLLEAKVDAKTIVGVLLSIIGAYSGPESKSLDQLAKYLSKRVRAALGSTTPAHRSGPVYVRVTNSLGGLGSGGQTPVFLVRPVLIGPVAAGNAPEAKNLHSWQHWGAPSTTSRGTLGYDTCKPVCANYQFTSGSATLSQIRKCGARLEYTDLRFTYSRKPKYDVTFGLSCAGKIISGLPLRYRPRSRASGSATRVPPGAQ